MGLAKQRKTNPRDLARQIVQQLPKPDWLKAVEVAGPGFINFKLSASIFAATLQTAAQRKHLFYRPAPYPRTVIVDFSSPNVAKPMHVGHIRSTILGDCLARILRKLGHQTITDNHIGDWGTQFGKLIVGWKKHRHTEALQKDPVGEMERLYRKVNAACDMDDAVLEEARQELVKLQAGDPENTRIWQQMLDLSKEQFNTIYQRLGVHFDHTLGESFYNSQLQVIVDELLQKAIAEESQGAKVVFFRDHPELKSNPAIIQKRDGAANYTTTDLATLDYRFRTWRPDEIIYVTDARQQLHFKQLFAIFQKWHPDVPLRLSHVWFGTILGEDGKPFKTRSGETIRLKDLLDEAEERAYKVVTEKNPDFPEEQKRDIARIVGLGAVKYADLLPNRQSDYIFSWDKMLALNGNTAPYLLYSYTRIRSIFRKAENEMGEPFDSVAHDVSFTLETEHELALARHLLNFGIILENVLEDYRPNYLCNYLYELSGFFARFYENCPVLKSEGNQRTTRMALCDLTARVLKQGLESLGIETTEVM